MPPLEVFATAEQRRRGQSRSVPDLHRPPHGTEWTTINHTNVVQSTTSLPPSPTHSVSSQIHNSCSISSTCIPTYTDPDVVAVAHPSNSIRYLQSENKQRRRQRQQLQSSPDYHQHGHPIFVVARKKYVSTVMVAMFGVWFFVVLVGYTQFYMWHGSTAPWWENHHHTDGAFFQFQNMSTRSGSGSSSNGSSSSSSTSTRLMALLRMRNSTINNNKTSILSVHTIATATNRTNATMSLSGGTEQKEVGPLVHIIHSRFMQNQPDLVHLGQARLQLFQQLFLKSLKAQSSKNFICIVRTDPQLDPSLQQPLITLLQESKLPHLLLASNDTPKSQFQDIVMGQIQPSMVWSGDLDAIRAYLGGTQSNSLPPRVLETRLDADDALHRFFVETLQAQAVGTVLPFRILTTSDGDVKEEEESARAYAYDFAPLTWRIWCVDNHAEWQYQPAWENPTAEEMEANVGSLISLAATYCVTPGLSVAFLGHNESIDAMPSTSKHERIMHILPCSAPPMDDIFGKEHMKFRQRDFKATHGAHITSNCRSFVPMVMAALRARTPTSAGMLNVVYNGKSFNQRYMSGAAKQRDIQDKMWYGVKRIFGFSKKNAQSINQYMKDHMKVIAEENLKGQCTHGHSCKNSSQIMLRSILDGAS